MSDKTFVLEKLEHLLHVGIVAVKKQHIVIEKNQHHNPLYHSVALREKLIAGAEKQQLPFLLKDEHEVMFGCIKHNEHFFMIGPMCLEMLGRVQLHQFYHIYKVDESLEKRLKKFSLTEVLDIIEIIANELLDEEYSDEELIFENHIVKDTKAEEKQEQIIFDLKEGEDELYHHTYQEERKLLDSIREGRLEDALRYSRNMDVDLGKLSAKELNHWKNVAIVAITLCTRAAIEAGVSPSIGYRISDFYIQKSDGCSDMTQIIKYRDHAVEELTKQVQNKMSRKTSSYVERCKDYVEKHYREKLYLSDIAENLGISETYLSRLFKRETGERLQDHIVSVRLERAVNLLKYSEVSLSNIAEYVNFPSQSYMGKIFKEKYHLSPKKYREEYTPAEFFKTKKGEKGDV